MSTVIHQQHNLNWREQSKDMIAMARRCVMKRQRLIYGPQWFMDRSKPGTVWNPLRLQTPNIYICQKTLAERIVMPMLRRKPFFNEDFKMPKTPAAQYAQMRRDNEVEAREALESLIPDQYFTTEMMENGDLTKAARVFIAMKSYLEDLIAGRDGGDQANNTEDKPFSIPHGKVSEALPSEQIRQLRQVATRLVQKVEEKLDGEEDPSTELRTAIDTASDLMVDTIEAIEKAK